MVCKSDCQLFDSANIKQQAAADSQKINEGSVVDEVIWVVGDEAILKSDVEVTRLQAEAEGIKYTGDPDCSIPEQIAVQESGRIYSAFR